MVAFVERGRNWRCKAGSPELEPHENPRQQSVLNRGHGSAMKVRTQRHKMEPFFRQLVDSLPKRGR
jgi:hypothetical protein